MGLRQTERFLPRLLFGSRENGGDEQHYTKEEDLLDRGFVKRLDWAFA